MTVFSKGADWAERIFEKLFNPASIKTEVVEEISINPEDTVLNITADQQRFDYGIVIKHFTSQKKESIKKEEKKDISLPVVIRIFSKTVPLSEIENIGETTEILISQQSHFDAELLVNGEVIGRGILKKEKNSFKLKILELFI